MLKQNIIILILYILSRTENGDAHSLILNSVLSPPDQLSSTRTKEDLYEDYTSKEERRRQGGECELIRDENVFAQVLNNYIYKSNQSLTCNVIEEDKIKSLPLKTSIDLVPSLWTYYLPNLSSNLSRQCYEDVAAIKDAYANPNTLFTENFWALKLVDSWGKLEDGVLQGNNFFLGFFEECLTTEVGGGSAAKGRYCLVTHGGSSSEDLRTPISTFRGTTIPLATYYGTCIPSSCTQEELRDSVEEAMAQDGLELTNVQCQSSVDEVTFDSAEIIGMILFSLLIFVILLSTAIDLLAPYFPKTFRKDGVVISLLTSFSFHRNMGILFNVNTGSNKRNLASLHGIRFMSITWVILGHQCIYSSEISSNNKIYEMTTKFMTQVIANGDKSVDTFFTMTGFLLSYNFFISTNKVNKFPIFKFYIHRLIRLTPPIAICVAFFATLAGVAVYGPLAPKYIDERVEGCQQFWWVDWTFFSNFVFRFGVDMIIKTGESFACVSQCWYTSVDMQIYLIMPLVLLPFIKFRNKNIGFYLLGAWTFASFLIPTVIIGAYHTYPSSMLSLNVEESTDFNNYVYLMPYCRASPYFVGIWAGYFLSKHKEKKIILKPYQVVGGWVLATLLGLCIIFGIYPWNQFGIPNPADDMKSWYSILYGGLHRGLWGVCVCWIIIACETGYGGMVNSFLSHPGIQPLSRLTYCIFLVSLPIQILLFYSIIRSPYYDFINKVYETCGVLLFTGIGALFLCLGTELPARNIEKLIWRNSEKELEKEDLQEKEFQEKELQENK